MKLRVRFKGGAGSGHHGHAGIPGKQGGSLPGTGSGSGAIINDLIDKHPNVLSDDSHTAYKAAGQLVRDLKERSVELGIYDEMTHWTGTANSDEYNKFVSVQNYMSKPSFVPESVQTNVFTNAQLPRYYNQEGRKGSTIAVAFFKRGLAGEFGDKHKAATQLIQDVSQEIFHRKYGNSATLYRGGSAVGMSVSESRSIAERVGRLLSNNLTVYELTVPVEAILFGERIIPSPYPEKEWVIDTSLIETKEVRFKGGPGSGHFGHSGIPGQQGGSLPGSGSKLPADERVWQGKSQDGKPFTNNQNVRGRIGEELATKAMADMTGSEFAIMNEGLNNAPIDVAGDHRAIEVKTGMATNGYTAQHWRITTNYTSGPTEDDLIATMTKSERKEYNRYKQTQALLRKRQAVEEMGREIGTPVKGATVGVILSQDGTKGDVFYIPDFHLRLRWDEYAIEEYYVGTYDVN